MLGGCVATASVAMVLALNAGAAPTSNGLTAAADIDPGDVHRLQLAFSFRRDHVGAEASPPASAGGLLFVAAPSRTRCMRSTPRRRPSAVSVGITRPRLTVPPPGSCCDRASH